MSEARSAILERMRRALTPTEREPLPPAFPPRHRRIRPGLLDLFVERVEDYKATVHRCPPDLVEETLAEVLGSRSTVVPGGFPWSVPRPVPDRDLTAAELEEIPAVVTTATLGIATTGTLVLTHGDGQGDPALSQVPDVHVCVVLADQLVLGVPDAVAVLDPHRPQTWVTGPSPTNEIELDRFEGRYGPRALHVVLVDLVEGGRAS